MSNTNKGVKSYENYVCPECWRPLGECKKSTLPYSLLFIDVNIQEIIRTLNNKGYTTVDCCEGHTNSFIRTYVSFSKKVGDMDLPKPPCEFSFSKSGRLLETKDYIGKSEKELEAIKRYNLHNLKMWVNSLPVLEDRSFNHETDKIDLESTFELSKFISEALEL